MPKTGQSIRGKREDRNADLAAERAKVVCEDQNVTEPEKVAAPRAAATWLRLQKGNPDLNPWLSPTFLVDAWSLASDDVEVPLLPNLPTPQELGKWRRICGLSVTAVAERAQVGPELWAEFEAGNEQVRQHLNESQLLKFASVRAVCVQAGGPPVPEEQAAPAPREPMRVVGAELLEDLAKEVDRFPLHHVIVDDHYSVRIARGEIPSPTATAFPSEKEMIEICRSFPGLASRVRSVRWTNSSLLQDLVEGEPGDAPYVPRDELGVGRAGLLRIIGTAKALIDADPERVAAIQAEREAADQRRQEQEAAAIKARAAVAQASLLLAQREADLANAAVEESAA